MRPSALDTVYWSHTLNDLQVLTRLKMEQEVVRANAFTESLILVASQIFGGGEGSSSSSNGPENNIDTADELVAAVRKLQ